MANFVSWATELQRAKDAIASRKWDQYFTSSVENSEEMRTTYTILGNVTAFIEWLEKKASDEALGVTSGSLFFTVGGC